MGGIIKAIFGGGDDELLRKQLAQQEEQQRIALAQSINQEAREQQQLASVRRGRGARRILAFLDNTAGGRTLG